MRSNQNVDAQGWLKRPQSITLLVGILFICSAALSACSTLLGRPLPAYTPAAVSIGEQGPAIAVSPTEGSAGVYVQVVGEGWPLNGLVLITLSDERGRSGILAASTADETGAITTGFLYPISQRWLQPGTHTVLAYTADGNQQATAVIHTGTPQENPPEIAPTGQTATATTTGTPAPTETSPSSAEQTPVATQTSARPTSTPTVPPSPSPIPVPITDWRGEYWNNSTMSGQPRIIRNDLAVFFDWGSGSPGEGVDSDHFSARWTRSLLFDAGVYRFSIEVDDGARLYVDGELVIDAWRSASKRTVTADVALSPGEHSIRVEYFERSGSAVIRFWWERQEQFSGWKAEYYPNRFLDGQPALVRDDPAIDFHWSTGSPAPNLPEDNFSVRWQRPVHFGEGSYRFFARTDDGIRVWIGSQLIIDEWKDGADRTVDVEVTLPDGPQPVRVEYYEHTGGARAGFWWQAAPTPTPTAPPTETPSPLPTATPSYTPSWTATVIASPTWSLPTAVPTKRPTETPTALATANPTQTAAESTAEAVLLSFREVELPILLSQGERLYTVISTVNEWEMFIGDTNAAPIRESPPGERSGRSSVRPPRNVADAKTPPVDFEKEVLFVILVDTRMDRNSTVTIDQLLWYNASNTVTVRAMFETGFISRDARRYAAVAVARSMFPTDTEVLVRFADEQNSLLSKVSFILQGPP